MMGARPSEAAEVEKGSIHSLVRQNKTSALRTFAERLCFIATWLTADAVKMRGELHQWSDDLSWKVRRTPQVQ